MFGMKKKTPEEKMEKMVQRSDWNGLNDYCYGDAETKITLAKACAGSIDNSCIDILLRLVDDQNDDVVIAAAETLTKVGTDHVTAELQRILLKTPKENERVRSALSAAMQALNGK